MSSRVVGARGPGFDYAVEHADLGWPLFPLMPGTKTPVPHTHGHLEATSDPGGVAGLWEFALVTTGLADLGVGVRCSGEAGFCVDLDVKAGKDGVSRFHELVDEHEGGRFWPAHWLTYRTRSGGQHVIFATPIEDRDRVVHTGRDVLGPGIDLRGPRGFRATYDPANPDGYTLLSGCPADGPPVAPEWLLSDDRLWSGVSAGGAASITLPEGEMCDAVWHAAQPKRWELSEHHDTASRIMHLVLLGEEGHRGVLDALVQLRPMYIEARDAKGQLDGVDRDAERDFDRMVESALGKGSGEAASEDPCARRAERLARFKL